MNKKQPDQLLVDTEAFLSSAELSIIRGKRLCPELTKILNEELHDRKRGA